MAIPHLLLWPLLSGRRTGKGVINSRPGFSSAWLVKNAFIFTFSHWYIFIFILHRRIRKIVPIRVAKITELKKSVRYTFADALSMRTILHSLLRALPFQSRSTPFLGIPCNYISYQRGLWAGGNIARDSEHRWGGFSRGVETFITHDYRRIVLPLKKNERYNLTW